MSDKGRIYFCWLNGFIPSVSQTLKQFERRPVSALFELTSRKGAIIHKWWVFPAYSYKTGIFSYTTWALKQADMPPGTELGEKELRYPYILGQGLHSHHISNSWKEKNFKLSFFFKGQDSTMNRIWNCKRKVDFSSIWPIATFKVFYNEIQIPSLKNGFKTIFWLLV